MLTNHINLIYVYEKDLELKNWKWLICNKTLPNPNKPSKDLSVELYIEIN